MPTAHLSIPYILSAQNSPEVTANAAFDALDNMPASSVLIGTLAARPAAGWPGRLYFVTDTGLRRMTRDNGSSWDDLSDSDLAGGSAITATAGAAAGGSPPAPVVVGGSNSQRGTVTFGTGTAPGIGVQCHVAYPASFGAVGTFIFLQSLNATLVDLQPTPANIGASGFDVWTKIAPAASQGNSTYQFSYLVVT